MKATAQASRVIPANEAEVWETLTSREAMKSYMLGADVQAEWRVGGEIVMRGEANGKPFVDRGEVRSFQPWRRLSYSHTSSASPDQTHLVTFELERTEDGTEVKVIQENADGSVTEVDRWRRAEYERTWSMILEKLETEVLN